MKKKLTIRTIAAEAGVSTTTVSRVINNKEPEKVGEEARKRVRKIVEKYNFTPSSQARNLICGKTRFIGLQLLSTDTSMAMGLISGVEKRAAALGYNIILGVSDWNKEKERLSVNAMIEKGVDGILWFPCNFDLKEKRSELAKIAGGGLPLVWLQKNLGGGFPAVVGNNENGGRMAARHVWNNGSRNIVFVGDVNEQHSRERFDGYSRFMAEIGAEPRLVKTPHKRAVSAEAVSDYLEERKKADAFVCASDFIALGVYDALARRGVGAGKDFAVVGYDDEVFSQYLSPPLTTFNPLNSEIGAMAVDHLLKTMEGQGAASIAVEAEIVVRRSCGENK